MVAPILDQAELARREEEARRQAEFIRRQEEELAEKRRLRQVQEDKEREALQQIPVHPSVDGQAVEAAEAAAQAAAKREADSKAQAEEDAEPKWLASFNANLERQTRILSDVNDNTKKSADYAPLG